MARKFFSCCLAGLVVPLLGLTLLLFGLKATVFDANFYQKSIIKMDLYNQLVDKTLPTLLASFSGGQNNSGPVNQTELIKIVKEILPPVWVNEQIKNISDATFSYIKGSTNSINLIINLSEKKILLSQKVANLAPQNQAVKPEDMKQMLASVPDQFDLGAMLVANPAISQVKQVYRIILLATWISLALSLIFLLIIGLANMFYPPGMMKWLSIPVMISSSLLFLTVITGQFILFFSISQMVSGLDANFKPLVQDILKFFLNPILTKIEWEAGIVFVLSLAILITAIILTHKFPPKTELPATFKKLEDKNGAKTAKN